MLFNTYPSVVNTIIQFLKSLNVKVSNATVNETLQNHPDWPSLLCISDALSKWNVPNTAIRIEADQLNELPLPFLAVTKKPDTPFYIINEVGNDGIVILKDQSSKPIKIVKDDFLSQWAGVCLIAEPSKESGEKDYKAIRRKYFYQSLLPAVLILFLVSLITFLFIKSLKDTAIPAVWPYILQWIFALAGLVVSISLLWYEIDKSNPILQKVCTGIAKGNCNAILTGKASKLFSWLSWSEAGFFYFTGALLCMLYNPANPVPYVLNLLALEYPVFSIYYQWRVAKQWCVLCLAVQAVLIAGGINVLINHLFGAELFSIKPYFLSAIFYILPTLTWFSIKPYILQLQKAKNTKREYLRTKFNTNIFDALLKTQKQTTSSADSLGILIGNPAATHEIIKVCNPYCGPCAKAHPEIEKLIEENSNLKARIIFTATNKEDDYRAQPVKHLLAIEQNNDEKKTKQALDDWYMAKEKDYKIFAAKYPLNGELQRQDAKIDSMEKWCNETGIAFTPTIFIDGYQMPDVYTIKDLNYFLLE
ncbi:MAG: thioredoxin domain-containing protein [Bacteroidetes bacterium]|nr:thioredoxin domain-containing protein [Bacteroidota bacterium]